MDVNPATCFFAKLVRFVVVMLLSLFQLHIVQLPPTPTLGASLCAFRLGTCSFAQDTRFEYSTRGSNPEPTGYKPGAQPIELVEHKAAVLALRQGCTRKQTGRPNTPYAYSVPAEERQAADGPVPNRVVAVTR